MSGVAGRGKTQMSEIWVKSAYSQLSPSFSTGFPLCPGPSMLLSVQFAAWSAFLACGVAVLACVLTVRSWLSASREVRRLRSIVSLQAEMAEISAAVTGLAGSVKRLSGRQAVWDHRDRKKAAEEADLSQIKDKNELRRRLGIVPGQPAPHK